MVKFNTVKDNVRPFHVLLYGEFGAGKTSLAAEAPGPIIFDTEEGTLSLRSRPEFSEIPIAHVTSITEITETVTNIKAMPEGRTIVVDTISFLRTQEVLELVRIAHRDNSSRNPDIPSQAEHNAANSRLTRLMMRLHRTNYNIVYIAHVREEKDDEGQTVLVRPGISPANVQAFGSLCDGVFYMESNTNSKGETTRTLYTQPTRRLVIKSRFGNIPSKIENPTWAKLGLGLS